MIEFYYIVDLMIEMLLISMWFGLLIFVIGVVVVVFDFVVIVCCFFGIMYVVGIV